MILERIFDFLLIFVDFFITLLPTFDLSSNSFLAIYELMSYGVWIVGKETFVLIMSSILAWFTIFYGWAVIEWVYKKIPGIN